jgi:hypothetical protein
LAAPKKPAGAKSDKLWRDAIMRAVRRVEAGQSAQYLERVADQVVAKALAGDMIAAKEIGDRLDGKPHQTAEVTHFRARAEQLSDDELAGYIGQDGGDGAVEAPENPSQLN